MNGFIAYGGGADGLRTDPGRVTPAIGGTARRQEFQKGESLLTWGEHGDVHVAARGTEAYLVLSGCVLEIQSGPAFQGQAEAAKILLGLFEAAGSVEAIGQIAKRLYGSFSIYYRNVARDEACGVSDQAGTRPLWRKWCGSGWAVSTHPMAIALSLPSAEFDRARLGVFLLYGGPIEPTHSVFAGVEALPPGAVVKLGSQGRVEEKRWYQFQHRPDHGRSLADWTDFCAERLIRAAERQIRQSKKPVVFFSGGVDSRLTAAALKSAGGDPLLVTLGDGHNLEIRVSKMAARALGLRHEILLRDKQWYLRALPGAVYETGAGYVFTHGHFSAAAAQVRAQYGADTFYLGDLCEAFSKLFCAADGVDGRMWTSEEFVRVFDAIRLPLYRPDDRNGTFGLLSAGVRAGVESAVRDEIVERHRKISAVSPEPLVAGDYCFRWESAPTLPTFYMFTDLRAAAAERSVMFDPDVHELLETLPAAVRNSTNFGARLIHRMQPLAAWMPNSNSLLPMCWPPAAHKFSRKVKPYLGKLRRKLIGDSHRTTGSWPKHAVLYATDPVWRKMCGDVLNNGDLFDAGLFDRDAVRRCWTEFIGGNYQRSSDVEKLVQLGLTQQLLRSGWTDFSREWDLTEKPAGR